MSWLTGCSRALRRLSTSQANQPRRRRLYGLDDPRTERFGRRCLMARRLVERGVRFVQVYSGGGHNDENWDAHGDVNKNHELHCGETDQPMAGASAGPQAPGAAGRDAGCLDQRVRPDADRPERQGARP